MQNQATTLQDALNTRFFAPLRRTRTRRIGVELEFPVWNRAPGRATDFAAVHAATDDFLARFPFSEQVRDDEGTARPAARLSERDQVRAARNFKNAAQERIHLQSGRLPSRVHELRTAVVQNTKKQER